MGNVNLRGFNSTGGAIPALVGGEDVAYAMLGHDSSIGTFSGWTQLGDELLLASSTFVKMFRRAWQGGDTMPTWGTLVAAVVGFYNMDVNNPEVDFSFTAITGANPGLVSLTTGAVRGDASLYMLGDIAANTTTPPANWAEIYDVAAGAGQVAAGRRGDLAPNTAISGTVTGASSERAVFHALLRTNNPRQYLFG